MDENKIFDNNENEQNEEITEEITETVEDAAETEEPAETEETYFEETEAEPYKSAEGEEPVISDVFTEGAEGYGVEAVQKKSKKGIIAAVILIVIVIALGACLVYSSFFVNKYNKMGYSDVSGMTLGEMCESMGVTLEEFKEKYELPADMPEDTYFNAAYSMMPVKVIAEMYGTDFVTLKDELQIPDMTEPIKHKGFLAKIKSIFSREKSVEITEDTPWGVVQDQVSLAVAVGEENMEEFKSEYGFGDEITLETKWGEVRPAVEKIAIEERIAAEKAEENNTTDETSSTSEDAETGETEETSGEEAEAGTEGTEEVE